MPIPVYEFDSLFCFMQWSVCAECPRYYRSIVAKLFVRITIIKYIFIQNIGRKCVSGDGTATAGHGQKKLTADEDARKVKNSEIDRIL